MHSIRHMWSSTYKVTGISVEYSTGPVEDAAEVAFNSNLSNLIDLNVELHMHLIPELDSAREMRLLNRAYCDSLKTFQS